MKLPVSLSIIAGFSLLSCGFSFAQNVRNFTPNDSIPLDTSIRYGKLENGFTYYIKHHDNPQGQVMMYQITKVGSDQEDNDQLGVSHLLEHTFFHKTDHFSNPFEYFSNKGIRRGNDLNASSGDNQTAYFLLNVPSDQKKMIEDGLLFLKDCAQGSRVDPHVIDKCRGEVIGEGRGVKSHIYEMKEEYLSKIIGNPGFEYNSPSDYVTSTKNFTYESVFRFYGDWYRPDLQAVIVIGDVNLEDIEKQIKELFSNLVNPSNPRDLTKYPPFEWKNQFITVSHEDMVQVNMKIYMKRPTLRMQTLADFRNAFIIRLYNEMIGSRLKVLNNQYDKPFSQILHRYEAQFPSSGPDFASISTDIEMHPDSIKQGFYAAFTEIERIRRQGFTRKEFLVAKERISKGMSYLKVDSKTFALQLVDHFVNGNILPSQAFMEEMTKWFISEMQVQDVNTKVREWISDKSRDIVILAPVEASLPDEQELSEWINQIQRREIIPYEPPVDRTAILPLMTDDQILKLPHGKILKRFEIKEIGLTKLVLSNGVIVYLKPLQASDSTQRNVYLHGFRPSRATLAKGEDYASAINSASIIAQSGLGPFDGHELRRYMDKNDVLGVSPYIMDTSQGIRAAAKQSGLESLFQIVHEYFVNPKKNRMAFERFLENKKKLMWGTKISSIVLNEAIDSLLNPSEFNRKTASNHLSSIDYNKCYKFYQEKFSEINGFTFLITGDFRLNTIIPLIQVYLGSIPSGINKTEIKELDEVSLVVKQPLTIIYGEHITDEAVVSMVFTGSYKYSVGSNIELDILVTILNQIITRRLRYKEGAIYNATVGAIKHPQGKFDVRITFGCSPYVAKDLISYATEEINHLKENGPDSDTIKDVIELERANLGKNLNAHSFWLKYLSNQLQNDRDLFEILNCENELNKLSQKSIQSAAKKYLSDDNFMQFILMPKLIDTKFK